MRPIAWRNAIRDSDLDSTSKLVCFVISTYMNTAGEAYSAKATLAKGASLGEGRRSVDQAIDNSEAAGYLEVTPPGKLRNGRLYRGRNSFRYRATTPNVAGDARLNVAGDATLAASNVASDDSRRRTSCIPTLQLVPPNVAPDATEVALKSKTEVEAESADPATAEEEERCDQCGKQRDLGEWPDGSHLCERCGRERARATIALDRIAKEMPA